MDTRTRFLIMLAGLLLVVSPAIASVWTVEQDGSGDFTVIQDAVDAAGDGDEIVIGPGRYTEYQQIYDHGLWWDIHVLIPDGVSLTFRGAGSETTIIGPEDPESHENRTYGILGIVDVQLTMSGIGVENCSGHGVSVRSGSLDIEYCRFSYAGEPASGTRGIDGHFTLGGVIRDCQFYGVNGGVATIDSPGGVLIERCTFECILGVYAWTSGSRDVQVSDCDFTCYSGIGFLDGAGGVINGCRLNNCAMEFTNTAGVTVTECRIVRNDGGYALVLTNNEPVTIVDNVFESNGRIFYLASYGLGLIRDNHFVRTGNDYWIYCPYHPTFQQDIDLSSNWWGTTNRDEIDAGIHDCNDDPQSYHCVLYEPIADDAVEVQSRSWGAVRGMFRD